MSVRVQERPELTLLVEYRDPAPLKPAERNARTHSQRQIQQIAASITEFGFVNPVLLDDGGRIIAGHGRVAAAAWLKLEQVPTLRLSHLTPEQLRLYAIADNRLAELAGWDESLLAIELQELDALNLDVDLEVTGYDSAELDELLSFQVVDGEVDPALDQAPEAEGPAVSRLGDRWLLGQHVVVCGDAREAATYDLLMAGEQARMMFADPPYGIPIKHFVGGRGKVARREFVMASDKMTEAELIELLTRSHAEAKRCLIDGAILYTCMDWRKIGALLNVLKELDLTLKNVAVWNKTNAGMGKFYRSQHELITISKNGSAEHLNTFGLGEGGRYRTNVWTYAGVNTFRKDRDQDLAMHPTVKPVALVVDALKDVSRRGDLVLDPFGGSGTTLIAAEKTRRRARLIELDPLYVDVICRRFHAVSGDEAVLESTGLTFTQTAAQRQQPGGAENDE